MSIDFSVLNPTERIIFELRSLYTKFGYKPFKMSKFEEYDLYLEYKKFLQTENIITFTDLHGKLYALKPDITLSIAKNANPAQPQKLYYKENVYRASKDTKEYKEITQLGLEYIGEIDSYTMAEAVLLAAKSLKLISESYILDISHMGFISGLFEQAGLSDVQQEKLLSFLGKKDTHEMLYCCEQFGIDKGMSEKIVSLCEVYGSFEETLPQIKALVVNDKMADAIKEMEELYSVLSAMGEGEHINLDFSIVNDMSYYNGVIYRGYVKDVPFSVLSGGRYDNLLQKLGKNCQAIGFAVYVDLLVTYTNEDSPAAVAAVAEKYISQGKSVKVLSTVPEALKYREKVSVSQKGAEE